MSNENMPELVPANNNEKTTAVAVSRFDGDFLLGVNQFAASFFKRQLWATDKALAFCRSRGISDARLEECEVGYAPESGIEFGELLQRYCSAEACRESGLLSLKIEDSTMFSRFRHRLMFPIYDNENRVVAFSGLALPPDSRKGPDWMEFNHTALYSPDDPPLNLKNVAMRVLQLQMFAGNRTERGWHELAKMVGRMKVGREESKELTLVEACVVAHELAMLTAKIVSNLKAIGGDMQLNDLLEKANAIASNLSNLRKVEQAS
jgi:hypothetical protein